MAEVDNLYQIAKPVTVADCYRDIASVRYEIDNESVSLATMLDDELPGNAAGCVVTHSGTVHYNPAGGASASNAAIDSVYVISGGVDILSNVRLFAASATQVSLVFFGRRSGEVALVTT